MRQSIAFDADVLIYAATDGHPFQERLRKCLSSTSLKCGSVLLLNEILTKPMRQAASSHEVQALMSILSSIDLLPYTARSARLGVVLGVQYGLRAADAVHLATAVEADADVFLTNNRKDFSKGISEIEVCYPEDL